MATINLPIINKKWRILIHGIGLSSIGSSLFLQSTVFTSILEKGYFRGVEQNQIILTLEIALTGVAIAYFGYMAIKLLFTNRY